MDNIFLENFLFKHLPSSQDEIVVTLFEKENLAKQIFVLQQEKEKAQSISFSSTISEVGFFGENLLFKDRKGRLIALSLNSSKSKEFLERLINKGINFKETYYGYGMARLKGEWILSYGYLADTDLSLTEIVISSSRLLSDNEKNRLLSTCTSGGAGSTRCSITEIFGMSCSVDCANGYYACCDSETTTCKCIENQPPPEEVG